MHFKSDFFPDIVRFENEDEPKSVSIIDNNYLKSKGYQIIDIFVDKTKGPKTNFISSKNKMD